MQILLNGEPREVADNLRLDALLEQAGYAGRKVAVEVNLAVVARSQHAACTLAEGDRVEIIHAIGGG
jgi:sulfur carrier protein